MDFWDITKVLFRRWYVTVPLLVVTAAAAISVGIIQKPLYQLSAYVELVPPAATLGPTTTPTPVNPWDQIGIDSLSTAAQLGTLDQTFLNGLKAQGNTPEVTINIGDPPSGDTFQIIGTSELQVQNTADQVLARFAKFVESLQTAYGIPTAQLIRTQRLDHGTNISRPNGKQLRVVIAAIGAGLIVTCAGAIFADYRSRRRRRPSGRARVAPQRGGGGGPIPLPRVPSTQLVTASARSVGDGSSSAMPLSDNAPVDDSAIDGLPTDDAAGTYPDFDDRHGEDLR